MTQTTPTLEGLRTVRARQGEPLALVLTAFNTETSAVIAHLENPTPMAVGKCVVIAGHFTTGAQPWWVLTATLHGAGNIDIGHLLRDVLSEFDDVALCLFVGVAGSRKSDIAVGDVVIGTKLYFGHAGSADTTFAARPMMVEPDFQLVQIAGSTALFESWLDRIKPAPTPGTPPPAAPPTAFMKPIVSVEQVVKSLDSETAKVIADHYNDACAVEMEGYGFLRAVTHERARGLVIRGISDPCENKAEHDASRGQSVAAANASAFAFEVLSNLTELEGFVAPIEAQLEDVQDHVPLCAPGQQTSGQGSASTTSTLTVPGRSVRLLVTLDATYADIDLEELRLSIISLTNARDCEIEDVYQGSLNIVLRIDSGASKVLLTEVREGRLPELLGLRVKSISTWDALSARDVGLALHKASEELLNWPTTLPDGSWIERKEEQTIRDRLKTEKSSTTVLLGTPGSGKSALLSRLAKDLSSEDWVVLGIKADLLSAEISNDSKLQDDLRLPYNTETCLRVISAHRPTLLILDQLDALASLSDLRSERLNLLLNLIRRISNHPGLHILASCRTFEYQHDVRLGAIDADQVVLTPPSWPRIAEVLDRVGIDSTKIPESARSIIQLPQTLRVFLDLSSGDLSSGDTRPQLAGSYQSMVDSLWRNRITDHPHGQLLSTLVRGCALEMLENETLWLPVARFEHQSQALDELQAADFIALSADKTRFGFRHQTLFEHACARAFLQREEAFARYVLLRQDSLFIRPRLWITLSYLRATDTPTYEREFESLWKTSDLRQHLRWLLMEFLGQQQEPSSREHSWLGQVLGETRFRRFALRTTAASPGWFSYLRQSFLPSLMAEAREDSAEVLPVLTEALKFDRATVLSLLRQRWLDSPGKDTFTWQCLDRSTEWDEESLRIMERILERTEVPSFQVGMLASSISASAPDLAPRVVFASLRRQLAAATSEAHRRRDSRPTFPEEGSTEARIRWYSNYDFNKPYEDLLRQSSGWYDLPEVAKAAPRSFVMAGWDFYKEVFTCLADVNSGLEFQYTSGVGLSTEFPDDDPNTGHENPLVAALVEAVSGYASQDPEGFIAFADGACESDLLMVNRLVAQGMLRIVDDFPDVVLEFLTQDPRRLALGGIRDVHKDSKALITAVSPKLNSSQVGQLEHYITQYEARTIVRDEHDVEQRRARRRSNRAHRLRLFRAIPEGQRSEKIQQMVIQEERALVNPPDRDLEISGFEWIGSPMSATQMVKATDAQIVAQLREVPDETEWDHPRDWRRGGSIQMARALAEFAKAEPSRAINIVRDLDPSTHGRPAAYVLESLGGSTMETAEYFLLVQEFEHRGYIHKDDRDVVARGIQKRVTRGCPLPDAMVELLYSWLSVEPQEEVAGTEETEARDEEGDRSILWGYGRMATLPDGNFPILETLAISYLSSEPPAHSGWLDAVDRHLKVKEASRVWKALLPYLRYSVVAEPRRGQEIVDNLFVQYPEIIGTQEGVVFLAQTHFILGESRVRRLFSSVRRAAQGFGDQVYGELLGLHHLSIPSARWADTAVQKALDARPSRRSGRLKLGLAHSAANMWIQRQFQSRATTLLVRLMKGADPARAKAIMDIFRLAEPLPIGKNTALLLDALCEHPQIIENGADTFLFDRLRDLIPYESERVYKVCRVAIKSLGPGLANISTAVARSAPDLVNIALTIHRLGGSFREQGLELFEGLLEVDAYGAQETLAKLDNRPTKAEAPRPRRVRRRRRKLA